MPACVEKTRERSRARPIFLQTNQMSRRNGFAAHHASSGSLSVSEPGYTDYCALGGLRATAGSKGGKKSKEWEGG